MLYCPLFIDCRAYQTNEKEKYPLKRKNVIRIARYFHYFQIKGADVRFFVQQKKGDDIWKHLWKFPLIEAQSSRLMKRCEIEKLIQAFNHSVISIGVKGKITHKLSHLDNHAVFLQS